MLALDHPREGCRASASVFNPALLHLAADLKQRALQEVLHDVQSGAALVQTLQPEAERSRGPAIGALDAFAVGSATSAVKSRMDMATKR
eukprot:scaffold846_cov252-Pinguiococcus_pyrenoidosus.AAC.30